MSESEGERFRMHGATLDIHKTFHIDFSTCTDDDDDDDDDDDGVYVLL
jgi:hypothetical protein